MKYFFGILIVFSLITIQSSDAQQHWYKLNSPTNVNLTKISFVDSLNGWICGDSGVIIHTSNAGQNWVFQNSKTKNYICHIFFLNKRLGWALAWKLFKDKSSEKNSPNYGTQILKTTNGGLNWDTSFYSTENVFLRNVLFLDSLTGFMAGTPANIIKTTNGGANWFYCQIDTSMVFLFPVISIKFYNYNIGYCGGGAMDIAGIIWRTTNGGLRWTPDIIAPEPIYDIAIFDSLNAVTIGGDFEYGPAVMKTTNGGLNWKYNTLGLFGQPMALGFRTNNEAWSPLSFSQKFIYSLDTAETWYEVDTPDSSTIEHLVFATSYAGYATGANGVILKYSPTIVGIDNNKYELIPIKADLFQNYPNPFNPYTKIDFSLSDDSFIKLKVYDISGREIRTIRDGFTKKGKYSVNFDGKNLPTGIYYYTLIIQSIDNPLKNAEIITKRMALIK